MKAFWALLGTVSLLLGAVGVVLPLLPTVPFVLLSAFCFARSSETAHNWLINHSVFGPMIEDWNRSGAISRRAKWAATASVVFVFSVSLVLGIPTTALIIQAVVLSLVMIFIWSRPDH